MIPADTLPIDQLKGKRVAFRDDEEHAACWHFQVGLRRGVVLRPAQTLAQKAEMVRGEGGELPDDWMAEEEEVPRVWVKADPSDSFPRGCEAAVEPGCLFVLEPGEE